MKLDELPQELLYQISTYLTLFDIGYSLVGVCDRLDTLLAENQHDRRTLAFHHGYCSYSIYRAFLNDQNGFRTRSLNTFIRSISLHGHCNLVCTSEILSRWADEIPLFLPSVRELTLCDITRFKKTSRSLAMLLACGTKTNIIGQLEKLTVISTSPDSWYIKLLHDLIFLQASCHTMIFQVNDGRRIYDDTIRPSLHVLNSVSGRQICFSRTVCLTLSLTLFTELLLLLQSTATPCLEQLSVTFERTNAFFYGTQDGYENKNLLNETYLITMNVMHLHTLTLCGIDRSDFSMSDVLSIIRYLKMTNLKSLTLIHVQTSSLNQLVEFQQAVQSSSLWTSLRHFSFSLWLPMILYDEYEATNFGELVFNTSDWLAKGWCVRHTTEEHFSSTVLVVYTYPYDLQDDRILINHRFVKRTIGQDRQLNERHIVWLCKDNDNEDISLHSLDTIEHSLQKLSPVYHLKWYYDMSPIGLLSSNFKQLRTYYPPLRFRSINFQVKTIDDTQLSIYANLLRNLLTSAVHLRRLSVPWSIVRELGRCHSSPSPPYRLRSLTLYFGRSQPFPDEPQPDYEPVDGSMLALMFPYLCHLSLCEGFFLMDEPLATMTQNLIGSLIAVNQFFNVFHVSCTYVRGLPVPRRHILLAELRKWLCLSRDSSSFSLFTWIHNRTGHLTIWL